MRVMAPALAIVVTVITLLGGCTVGEGPITSEARPVRPFDAIEVGSGIRLSMSIGPEHAIEVRAQENLIAAIGTEVRGSTLVIEATEDFTTTEPVTVTVVAPALVTLSMSGGARADIDGLAADDLTLDLRGGATASIVGSVDRLDLKVDGGAVAELADLAARTVSLRVDGGGTVTVSASAEVSGFASGGSNLTVVGGASLSVDTSGGANVAREGVARARPAGTPLLAVVDLNGRIPWSGTGCEPTWSPDATRACRRGRVPRRECPSTRRSGGRGAWRTAGGRPAWGTSAGE